MENTAFHQLDSFRLDMTQKCSHQGSRTSVFNTSSSKAFNFIPRSSLRKTRFILAFTQNSHEPLSLREKLN